MPDKIRRRWSSFKWSWIYIDLNMNKDLTESGIDSIDVRSQLGRQIQKKELKGSGWSFDKFYFNDIISKKLVD